MKRVDNPHDGTSVEYEYTSGPINAKTGGDEYLKVTFRKLETDGTAIFTIAFVIGNYDMIAKHYKEHGMNVKCIGESQPDKHGYDCFIVINDKFQSVLMNVSMLIEQMYDDIFSDRTYLITSAYAKFAKQYVLHSPSKKYLIDQITKGHRIVTMKLHDGSYDWYNLAALNDENKKAVFDDPHNVIIRLPVVNGYVQKKYIPHLIRLIQQRDKRDKK